MPKYHFAIHHDASDSENLGFMELANDDEALEFGRETISLIMQEDALKFAGSIMEITAGEREVGPIALEPAGSRSPAKQAVSRATFKPSGLQAGCEN